MFDIARKFQNSIVGMIFYREDLKKEGILSGLLNLARLTAPDDIILMLHYIHSPTIRHIFRVINWITFQPRFD